MSYWYSDTLVRRAARRQMLRLSNGQGLIYEVKVWLISGLCAVPGVKVLIVDQWIETGGTMKAATQLVERLGATVVGQSTC